MTGRNLRILLVDDSATVRALLRRLFSHTPGFEVAGEAENGAIAVETVVNLQPDVIVMDIEMPVMDGFAATAKIMAIRPTPIIVLTSRAIRNQVNTAFEAIRHGATEVIAKPENPDGWEELKRTLPFMVRAVSQARTTPETRASADNKKNFTLSSQGMIRYVAIGASTGGPQALHEFIRALPQELPAALLIVQHISNGFEKGLAEWLARDLHRDVGLAEDGEIIKPGMIRLAPAAAHLLLENHGTIRLDSLRPPRGGHRPSADELFLSCAASHPHETAGVLLSGMGRDGAAGLLALRHAGGLTMVQNSDTAVIFGMPKAALEDGAAEIALAPKDLAKLLGRHWHGGRS